MEERGLQPSVEQVETDLAVFVAVGRRRWRTRARGLLHLPNLRSVGEGLDAIRHDEGALGEPDPNLLFDAIEQTIKTAIEGLPDPHSAAALDQFGFSVAGGSGSNDSKTEREDLAALQLGRSGRWYRLPNQREYGGLKPAEWHINAVAKRLMGLSSGSASSPDKKLLGQLAALGVVGAYERRRDISLDFIYSELERGDGIFVASRHLESLKYERARRLYSKAAKQPDRPVKILVTPMARVSRLHTFLSDVAAEGGRHLDCRTTPHLDAAIYASTTGAFITLYGYERAGDDSPVLHCRPGSTGRGLYELYLEDFMHLWHRAEPCGLSDSDTKRRSS